MCYDMTVNVAKNIHNPKPCTREAENQGTPRKMHVIPWKFSVQMSKSPEVNSLHFVGCLTL